MLILFFLLVVMCSYILLDRSGELVDYISGMPSSAEIIRAMDEISDTVGLAFVY